jgi:hypothetical protein
MPNWCNNVVELGHEDPAMLERARDAFTRGELLNEFIPVPKDLQIVAGRLGDGDEQKKLEEDTARNVEKYGYGNWYDFCVNEWGTKWDIGGSDYDTPEIDNGQLTLSFDSAWSPPIGAYEKLCDLGFSVRGYYYEPGMSFCGVWDEGYDDFYQIEGSWELVRDEIPEALDEMFGISENMREYEEENAEEESE